MQTRKEMQSRLKKQRKSAVHFSPTDALPSDELNNLELGDIQRANYSPPKTA